jgi:hypothetical protein
MIYIYCSFEQNALTSNVFYRINNTLVKKHKLNDAAGAGNDASLYDTSLDRQRVVVKEINKDIEKIHALCMKYQKPMPTEIKIVYDVARNNMKAEYQYDLIYSGTEDKSAMMICDQWFDTVKKSLVGGE